MHQDAVERFRVCIPLFQALSDSARQDIILLLAEQQPLTVNEIAASSNLSRPAISHHLKILRDNGLLAMEQQGTQRYYSLSLENAVSVIKNLVTTVEETCL
ncbi:ArsR/SmtB family transcription factor [Marinicrinis sediminis]|uniref:ArsR/SmtB family transcription factor n=1 Tax=Marinicrinis sediminis TaxID=1652465 RepID=A0ABW5RF36_9BACL